MSSPAYRPAPDAAERAAAIDPRQSFLIQAPAGSGKTELLIQRFLRLLAVVDRPEAIVAITFTRKAAGEMISRIVDALRAARENTPVQQAHRQSTRQLAEAALRRDQELGWNILDHPARLRVQTIDSLCTSIAAGMPWLARLGGMPRIEEKARELYREAARRTILLAGDPEYGDAISRLLGRLDNDATLARDLIATMLGTREQWIALAVETRQPARRPLEEALERLIASRCKSADRLLPVELREVWLNLARYAGQPVDSWPGEGNADGWKALIEIVLTGGGEWRKQLTAKGGFPPADRGKKREALHLISELACIPGLEDALAAIRELPPPRYSEPQWDATLALLGSLKLAVAQLRVVFRENGVADFSEIGMAAREALGANGAPTDLAFRLDSRIGHLLVDEFQDTSRGQFELIRQLTANWQPGDGRTLFLVGDPMQSIYRFRQAEVGIFLETRRRGIGHLRLKPLTLVSNYRSNAGIVDRVNQIFGHLFPTEEDAATGAVGFQKSQASEPAGEEGITVHGFRWGEDRREAERVVELIREAQGRDPRDKIAVLVRARTHLQAIVEALKSSRIPFRAVEIDPLDERPVVLDMFALTRAMLHRADRIAWLAILRAPWCGLGLADLELLGRHSGTVWDALQDVSPLSEDGRRRALRLRDVLAAAFERQGRWPLRRWVERAWIQLGGPACLEGDEGALSDAGAYLDHLEARESSSDLPSGEQFERGLKELFAQPDPAASDSLQVMTIHKAKGLEFDIVIVPGLGRAERTDDSPLVLFHEWADNGEVERLLAPFPETGGSDPLYECLRRIEHRKSNLERVRLLYVAATRARKRLHLLGQAKLKKNGDPAPDGRSMLADLWPALSDAERATFVRSSDGNGPPAAARYLRRLPESWAPPELPANLSPGPVPAEAHEPSFEWVGESLRQAGTVVHELLRRARGGIVEIPPPAVLRRLLLHSGVIPTELGITLERVTDALSRMRNSAHARWILADHLEARSEYAISGMDGAGVVRGKVDRTFVDEKGVRWIVDFKTSEHMGGSREEFLDEQQRRYGDQLARYASLLAPLGRPVRVGLYFPLLDEWREWPAVRGA
ncbi:MAG TPA: UvrD-helicase domain-containing protein [Bryobacteraceae bacterium]|nr:UvrD-helicase domain-containing protein [Bryobacteraceae bacterium]